MQLPCGNIATKKANFERKNNNTGCYDYYYELVYKQPNVQYTTRLPLLGIQFEHTIRYN